MSIKKEITIDISDIKSKIEELENQIKQLQLSYTTILRARDVQDDKKATHIRVFMILGYNHKSKYIQFNNLSVPIDLFNCSGLHCFVEKNNVPIRSKLMMRDEYLSETHDKIVALEEINQWYHEYTRKKSFSNIIQFVKDLNIADFDETQNKEFRFGRFNTKCNGFSFRNQSKDGFKIWLRSHYKENIILFLELY